jgi:hypothetical protein
LPGTVIDITNQIAGSCDHPFKDRSGGSAREEAMADNREATKFKKAPDGHAPTETSFKLFLLPIFCLVVSIGLLGVVVTNALRTNERQHQVALIQGRLDNLKARMDGSQIRSRQESLKFRTVANRVRIGELLAKQNNPTVKCEPAAATDDPARLESLQACREFARKEQEDIQNELAAARAESEAIQQDNAVLQKEVDSIHTQVDALQREIKTVGK